MKRTFVLCVIVYIVINARNSVVLSGTTVNLVSVLRRDLMKNNEDFEDDEPPAFPALPPRRADFLQPNKLLDYGTTDYEADTFTFQIQQSPTARAPQLQPLTAEVRAVYPRPKHKKTKTTSAETMITIDLPEVTEHTPTFDDYEITDPQQLRFNDALKLSMNRTDSEHSPTTTALMVPHLNKLKETSKQIGTKNPLRQEKVTEWLHLSPDTDENYEISFDLTELDMQKAMGKHMAKLRANNRLCDRNVLKPEGPKYDKNGKVYHQEYNKAQGDFANTPTPKYIVPKCCNCCRKSQLGCE